MTKHLARPLLILAALGCGSSATEPLEAQGLKSGNLLVANQEDATASLIDLRTDATKVIPVGIGPHEAQISPSGRTGVVTIYGQQPAGNQLAVIDIATGTVTRTISLGQYTRPHGVLFFLGDESRVVVTSEATQNVVLVNIATGTVEGAIPTGAQGLAHGGTHRRRQAGLDFECRLGRRLRNRPGEQDAGARDPGGTAGRRASPSRPTASSSSPAATPTAP